MERTYEYGHYMMATQDRWKADGELHDYTDTDGPSLVMVYSETDDYYIGNYVTGLGIVGLHFPKATTRPLTEDEIKHYANKQVYINSTPTGQMLEKDLRERIPDED